MAIKGFDFMLLPEGEILMDPDSHDITTVNDNELKVQLAYNRIKSISMDWFVDNVGADLEELIGKPCNHATVERGRLKIMQVLTVDELWNESEMYVSSQVLSNIHIIYTVYLKLYKEEEYSPFSLVSSDPYAYEITAELDLVKGVFIRMGWNPRAMAPKGIGYATQLTYHRKGDKS